MRKVVKNGGDQGPIDGVRDHFQWTPGVFRSIFDSDQPIAVGRAVADTGWTGVFGMATLSAARGRGAAKRVLSAIVGWAVNQHAPRIYLQVETDNVAARRLYESAGLTEIATYHYRLQSLDPTVEGAQWTKGSKRSGVGNVK